MGDRKLFYEDPALDRVDTQVIDRGELDGKPWVRLAETVFYPEGGGQPADRGTIAGIRVVDVRSRGTEVLHLLERPPDGDAVRAQIDTAWRFDLRQQHTAQHLLTAVLADRHGRATTSFHLGESYTAIEVGGSVPDAAALRRYEAEVNERIREDRAVRTYWIEPDEVPATQLRTRGLPEGHAGPVRVVEIDGIDRNTCGGTHVGRLGEIQMIHLLGAEAARGGARIRFLAGNRVLRELAAFAEREAALKQALGTGPEEFASALAARESAQRALERRHRELRDLLAERWAAELVAEDAFPAARFLPGADPELLRAIAGLVVRARPGAQVALVASSGSPEEACFVVQNGADGPADAAGVAERLAAFLGARGGGRGRFHQGRGGKAPGATETETFLRSLFQP